MPGCRHGGLSRAPYSRPLTHTWSCSFWATYVLVIGIVHITLLSIPVISTATAWTLTNVAHAVV